MILEKLLRVKENGQVVYQRGLIYKQGEDADCGKEFVIDKELLEVEVCLETE